MKDDSVVLHEINTLLSSTSTSLLKLPFEMDNFQQINKLLVKQIARKHYCFHKFLRQALQTHSLVASWLPFEGKLFIK